MKHFIIFSFFFILRIVYSLLTGGTCDTNNDIFVKSIQNMVVENTNDTNKWESNVTVHSAMLCPGQCQKIPECKSVSYDHETNICLLRDVDRMSMNAEITLSPNVNYYEKKKCPYNQTTNFIRVIEDGVDCKDIYEKSWKTNGVYAVKISGKKSYQPILCEMSLFGGGWTVIRQRIDGSVDFDRKWLEYKKGFGTLNGEFWYGNDRLHQLTHKTSNEVVFVLEDKDGVFYYPMYNEFKVASEINLYRLTLGTFLYDKKGPTTTQQADDIYYHQNMAFSSNDADYDTDDIRHCGNNFDAGWWFRSCCYVNLNGKFGLQENDGIKWTSITYDATGTHSSLRSVKILIRKKRNM